MHPAGRRFRAPLLALVLAVVPLPVAAAPPVPGTGVPTFERDIRPLLKAHCFHCHGEDGERKGGVDLRLRRLMLSESDSGPVVLPGDPDASVLLRMVRSGEMPRGEKKLTPDEVARIEAWIRGGAPTVRPEPEQVPEHFFTEEERSHWAFQPVRRVRPPSVRSPDLLRSPIDAFLLARLESEGLAFAPEADRRTLARRVSFDLTGLPPDPDEVDRFVSDPGPDAYERLVERLLASPRYGERWARHWLDVAGYADSNGGVEADSERAWTWRYRDYVIRAFNADLPYDRFVTEQLAGDELVERVDADLAGPELDAVVATGFLRLAPDPTGDNPPEPLLARNQVVADTLHIVSSSLLGLTVQCAQCHDHRYDPIPQRDYFRLRAVFEPAFDVPRWKPPGQRQVSLMPAADRDEAACIDHAAAAVDREAQELHDALIAKFVEGQLAKVPEERRESVMEARRTPAASRTPGQLALLREFPTFQDHIILGEVDAEGARQVAAVRARAAAIRATRPPDPQLSALVEEPGVEAKTLRFHRGDPEQPREEVPPGDLSILDPDGPGLRPEPGRRGTSGRRLALARALTSGNHPLLARVWVNRVWQHHFGAGLVATPGDFGALGEHPSHPELLDWLAGELVAGGWSLKSLHRRIVNSAAYRQGLDNEPARLADPDNRLLGRRRPRRLEAETLRDALVAVSGRLHSPMFGPPVPVAVDVHGQVVVGSQRKDGNGDPTGVEGLGGDEFRRAVYVQVRRSRPVGLLETFDRMTPNPNCEVRPVSTVPSQSLSLMNDPFVLARAADLSDAVVRGHPGDRAGQVREAWRRVLGAGPSSGEVARALAYLEEQAGFLAATGRPEATTGGMDPAFASLCQALLASNRFLYVD